jgi:hypothetical protein
MTYYDDALVIAQMLIHAVMISWVVGKEFKEGIFRNKVIVGHSKGSIYLSELICGVGIAIVIELLGIPVLPFAVGLYLPIYLSTPIFVGGLIRWFMENRKSKKPEEEKKACAENGVLYCSGMIAGEGLVGILLAVFAVIPFGEGSFADKINLGLPLGNVGGIVLFALIIASVFYFSKNKKNKIII